MAEPPYDNVRDYWHLHMEPIEGSSRSRWVSTRELFERSLITERAYRQSQLAMEEMRAEEAAWAKEHGADTEQTGPQG